MSNCVERVFEETVLHILPEKPNNNFVEREVAFLLKLKRVILYDR